MGAAVIPTRVEVFDALAALLAYPSEGFVGAAREAKETLAASDPALGKAVAPFVTAVEEAAPFEMEERYARAFDWSTTACLEIGWHLFGEQYERGAFLVEMRRRLRESGVEEGTDLPDHLTSVLRWLGRADALEARRFAGGVLVPALDKIRAGMGAENAWAPVLAAVDAAVRGLAESLEPEGGR